MDHYILFDDLILILHQQEILNVLQYRFFHYIIEIIEIVHMITCNMFENDYKHSMELQQDHNQASKQEEIDPMLYLRLLQLPKIDSFIQIYTVRYLTLKFDAFKL